MLVSVALRIKAQIPTRTLLTPKLISARSLAAAKLAFQLLERQLLATAYLHASCSLLGPFSFLMILASS